MYNLVRINMEEDSFKIFQHKIKKWGNSLGIVIPKYLCDHYDLKEGDLVELKLVASAKSKKKEK